MERLVEQFEALFVDAFSSEGRLSETARLAHSGATWEAVSARPEPRLNAVVERHLEQACRRNGARDREAHPLASALLPVAERLHWRMRPEASEGDGDMAEFARNYTAATVIGPGGVVLSDDVRAGFSLQAPMTFYPPHAHHAEESYWIVGGGGELKVDAGPWFPVTAGDSVYHSSWAVHSMRTCSQPMLSVWLWTSHLDSDVVMLHGQELGSRAHIVEHPVKRMN